MRLCVIGNSHLAALRMGWSSVSAMRPDVTARFFGAPAASLLNTRLVEDRIVPTEATVRASFEFTSSGLGVIDLSGYDRFVVCAGLGLRSLANLFSRVRSDEHVPNGGYFVSEAVFKASAFAAWDRSAAVHILELLKASGTGSRVVVLPNPKPSEAILEDAAQRDPWRELRGGRDGASLSRMLTTYLQQLTSETVSVRLQPEETCSGTLFSRREFSEGSSRLLPPEHGPPGVGASPPGGPSLHPADEYFHMNGAYGAAVWKACLAEL